MKPVRRMDSTTQSCSCTSCLYKSESEQPSIRKYIAHGSKIDRLYYGKYIPLRERKLLNRLVRTRAVYDDLRARLISDSTLSLEKNADLRPGKHRRVIKTLDSDKSGAILELVDIIDKGAALDSKKLSECCSCCSCSSKSKILDQNKKKHRRKGAYVRRSEDEYSRMGQIGTGEGGFARTYEREYKRTVPGRIGERYNKRVVRFKAKHIRSDPCTCTFKFSGLIKKHSEALFRKIRPLPLEQPSFDAVEQYIFEKSKKQNFARKSFQKYKKLHDKLEQDLKKLNESRTKMKQNLKLRAKKSLEQVKQVKNKLKDNIESGVRKSVQGVKALYPKDKTFEAIEYPEAENTFQIKKDSIVKFKDYLKRKQMMKDWECDLECEPEVCVPEECFKIIKLKRFHKHNRERYPKQAVQYEMIKREKKVGGAPLSRSSSGIQAGHFATTTATHIKKQKPILRFEGKNQLMGKRFIVESEEVKKKEMKEGVTKIAAKSNEISSRPTSYDEKATTAVKKKGKTYRKDKTIKEKGFAKKEEPVRGRQAVRIKSSFSFDMEFSKNPPRANTSQSSQPSGIHIRAPVKKRKKVHRPHIKPHVVSKSSLVSSQNIPENIKTRLMQIDKHGKVQMTSQQADLVSKISQCECKERLSSTKTNTVNETKSVSSSTIKSVVATTDKMISKEVKQKGRVSQISLVPVHLDTLTSNINERFSNHKQAVRIGSTFSFNIEFYKKGNENELKTRPVKEKVKITRSKNVHVRRKLVQVKGTSAKAYNQAKNTLRRCFCTLKLQKNVKAKKKTKSLKTASVMCLCEIEPPASLMIDKFVETKKRYRQEEPKLYHLLPYECEPGICVPDECDPILCKKILDLRRQKRRLSKSVGSYTGSRKTKSTSSIISGPFTFAKAKTVQSSIVPTKTAITRAPRRYKNTLHLDRKQLIKTNINVPERQAVRIGSSFSFNIEFYKDKEKPDITIKKSSLSNLPPEKYEQRKLRDKNKLNKSIFTQVISVDKYVGPSLKRCLCTLKLYKNKVSKIKKLEKPTKLTTNTQTYNKSPIEESMDKGTWTKKERQYKLLPYECEPYTCVPGECDPYICLQNIKRRELNTRNISAFTDTPDMRSMSSITESSFKKSEAILVQPKLIRKGTNMKSKYINVLEDKERKARETFKASKSKQAVKIGSSFNFSIEFSKQVPVALTLTKQPKRIQPSRRMDKDESIKVTKVRVSHVNTQALEPKKRNRAALVRPMLKRCFCTLNLQKKTKQYHKDLTAESNYFAPKVYTVGRAATMNTKILSHSLGNVQLVESKCKITSKSTSSVSLTKYVKSLKSNHRSLKLYSALNISNQSQQPIIMKSSLSMKVDVMRKFSTFKEAKKYNIKPLTTSSHTFIYKNYQESSKHIANISKYLERSFCTMNVQITNQTDRLDLKPYECEPGICTPGECNPYECKKLIMKRFANNFAKSSNTTSTNKSISSYVSRFARLDSKSSQMQTNVRNQEQIPMPLKYNRKPKQRQAVRIKSSFSFDLEFYKHQSQPLKKYINREEKNASIKKSINENTNKSVRIGTQEKKIEISTIQPNRTSVHAGTTPMSKRCFCTLKLQKKGRAYREYEKFNNFATTPVSFTSRNVKIGTNTKHNKMLVKSSELKFYECEPGICVPGQCNPYKCLELMKQRQDSGASTIRKRKKSVSSMTSGTYSKSKYKSRAVDAVSERKHHKSTKAMKYIKAAENGNQLLPRGSSRSAVRIGSNFSFNIEFFKDIPQIQQYKETNLTNVKISKSEIKQAKDKKEFKTVNSLSNKSVSHKIIEEEKPAVHKQHQESIITTLNTKDTKTFKHKCFCLLGLRPKEIRNDQHVEKTIKTAEKLTNTNYKPRTFVSYLEPHKQEELPKQYSKVSETEPIGTQSVSSSFGNNKWTKNVKTQAQPQDQNRQKHIQHSPPTDNIALKADKPLVRIGSNFSFNIEFFKENVNNNDITEKVKAIKTYPVKNELNEKIAIEHNLKSGAEKSEIVSTRNNKLQMNKITKPAGVSPLLKRCLCTLKLMNKSINQMDEIHNNNKPNATTIITTKSVETQSNKRLKSQFYHHDFGKVLSPYECEPFVCIPGECNPLECLKRIKTRQQQQTKEFGTVTNYPQKKSIGSVGTKMKDQNLQVKHPSRTPNKGSHKVSYVKNWEPEKSYKQPRQAVRIGSNFSFNIEFSKDIGNNLPKTVINLEETNIQNYSKKKLPHHTKPPSSYVKRDVDSQIISTKLQSTKTTMAHLRRCFCTLPLRNSNSNSQNNTLVKIPSDHPKSNHSKKENFLKKCMCTFKFNKVGKLQDRAPVPTVKYEIKGTSTDNQDHIQKPIRTLEPYECEPYICIPGECDPYECLKRIQQRPVRNFGTDYKRYVKDSATDSIKQPTTRSTKAQYNQKQKLHSRGTSLASKKSRRSKEITQYPLYPPHDTNRQVVRIGSNFSFNVEFYKDRRIMNNERKDDKEFITDKKLNMRTSLAQQPKKVQTKYRESISTVKRVRDNSSQNLQHKKPIANPAATIAPRRCFCTLQLLNKTHHPKSEDKLLLPTLNTKDKTTATKVKYIEPQKFNVCKCPPFKGSPGEFNPYEYSEKIKKINGSRKSRTAGMRTAKTSIVSVRNRTLNLKTSKDQSQIVKRKNVVVSTPYSEPHTEILQPSRFIEHSKRPNKRAVRIGSNFNFKVEFFKQKFQPAVITIPKIVKTRGNVEDTKSYLNKNVTAEEKSLRNYNLNTNNIKLKHQASDAGNVLKRCFCTLQLQKPVHQEMAQIKMHHPGNNVRYPQTFTVGRVQVEPFFNNIMKSNPLKKIEKARSTFVDPKLLNRTVGTKTNKKYLGNTKNDFVSFQCNPSNCPDYQKRIFRRKAEGDMQTILPYTPSKFNKTKSKTYVSDNSKMKRSKDPSQVQEKEIHKPSEPPILVKDKRRLTAKKSKKSIPNNSLKTTNNLNGSFFCRCVRFFTRRSETDSDAHGYISKKNRSPNPSKIESQRAEIKLIIPPKKAKSFGENCPFICPDNSNAIGKNDLQDEDRESSIMKKTKSQQGGKSESKHPQMKVTFADNLEDSKNGMLKKSTNKSILSKSRSRSRLCYSCSVNGQPLKQNNLKSNQLTSDDFRSVGKSIKSNKKAISYSESANNCYYCKCCKKKIDTDEISKGGGDRRPTIVSKYERDTGSCPCGTKSINGTERKESLREDSKSDKLSRKYSVKEQRICTNTKPLFEMRLDSTDHMIINKDDVRKKLDQLSNRPKQIRDRKSSQIKNKHDNLCICCKCLKKQKKMQEIKISVPANGPSSILGTFGKVFSARKKIATKPPIQIPRPCICGSKKCAAESKKKTRERPRYGKVKLKKTCVCGSNICTTESQKLKKKKERRIRKVKRKTISMANKKEWEALKRRIKIQENKDERRRHKRIKRNKELERRIKNYKNASDIMLAVDSLVDVGRLGVSSLAGALRYTSKAVIDPKVTCEMLCKKCRKKDQEALLKQLQKDYVESNAASTLKRLKMRCLLMNHVKTLRERLESNVFTHFLLHLADKNPKTRKFKRKPKRRIREPLDFQCSLYMATLRRRPYLCVYYKCPSFYPHFMTMVNIFRQFTDIMLFLLAAVVWSPCILCMEGCRALMCCFFCTG